MSAADEVDALLQYLDELLPASGFGPWPSTGKIMRQAAAEIRRLRAEVERLKDAMICGPSVSKERARADAAEAERDRLRADCATRWPTLPEGTNATSPIIVSRADGSIHRLDNILRRLDAAEARCAELELEIASIRSSDWQKKVAAQTTATNGEGKG